MVLLGLLAWAACSLLLAAVVGGTVRLRERQRPDREAPVAPDGEHART